MVEGRDEASGGEPVYQWPTSGPIEAPPAIPGFLVNWTRYRGVGENGWLAWIGGQRIGRVTVDSSGGWEWWCSLPSEEDKDVSGFGDEEECKVALVDFAKAWVEESGLAPTW